MPDARWDRPLQLLGGLHYLALRDGIDPWSDPAAAVAEHAPFLRSFVAEHGVQTNEVQRSWLLLPCFLELARRLDSRLVDLVEIGPSAGLNLVWDRYRYHYANGDWGRRDARLELSGDERRPVPAEILGMNVAVAHRHGIDLEPIDLTREEDVLLLKSFVWPDHHDRLERLDRAVATVRDDPPALERADAVERLPAVLANRRSDVPTVVFQTAVIGYLGDGFDAIQAAIEDAAGGAPLAFLWTARPQPDAHDYWGLWLRTWPGGDEEILAHGGFHGQWLEWVA